MKTLVLPQQPTSATAPCQRVQMQDDLCWQGFTVPEIPSAETPGSQAMQHAVECVLQEAASLGLSLQGTHALIVAALGNAGRALTLEDLNELVCAHARA